MTSVVPQPRSGEATAGPVRAPAPRTAPLRVLVRLVDGSLVVGLAAFAAWTVLYEVALATSVSLWTMLPLWVGLCAVGAVAAALAHRRGPSGERARSVLPGPGSPGEWVATTPSLGRAGRIGLALAFLALAGLTFRHRPSELTVVVLLALALILTNLFVAMSSVRATTRAERQGEPAGVALWQELVALVAAVAAAVFSSLLLNTDADDAYYVNRSVWVAEHGSAALKDTVFGPQTTEVNYGAGVPIASIEGLLGALAHGLQVSAGSLTYLVAVPVVAFFAVWSLWSLLRAWAPRRALLALVVALLFVLMSGSGVIGNYSFGRLWQGKVMAVTVLVPVIWLVASRLVTRGARLDLALMFVSGVCFVGFTSTAVILAPVVTGSLLVAAGVLRSRRLATGALLFLVAPLVAGILVAVLASTDSSAAADAPSRWGAFGVVLGWSPWLVTVAVVALVALPLTVRRGGVTVVAAAAGAVPFAVLLPGALPLANSMTGTGPVLWRLLLAAPVAAAVGLLTTTDLGLRSGIPHRALSAAVAACVVAVLLVAGTPIWSADVGAVMTSRPRWKVDPIAQPVAARIARIDAGPGPVLLPHAEMRVIPMTTTQMFALVPRELYAAGFPEPRADKDARFLLYRLVARQGPLPSKAETRAALRRLEVSLVCANRGFSGVLQRVRAAGYRPLERIDRLVCLTPSR